MNDVALVPISWIRTVALAFALAIVGVFFLGRYTAPTPKPMPAKVQARLVEHKVQTVIDSQRVKQLEGEVDRLEKKVDRQTVRAARADSDAVDQWRIADSLKQIAIREPTKWEEVANAALRSAAAALEASQRKDSIIAVRDTQLVRKDEIISTTKARADRADARIAELVPLASGDDGCRILWVFGCPSRKETAVIAAVATTGAILVGKKIKIRLPIG